MDNVSTCACTHVLYINAKLLCCCNWSDSQCEYEKLVHEPIKFGVH